MKMVKRLLGIAVIGFFTLGGGECYCDEDLSNRRLMSVNGSLSAIDTFESTITVKWQGDDLIHYNYTTFKVPDGMQFYKNGETVDLLDLIMEEPVTVEYYIDDAGNPKLVRMDIGE